MIATSTPVELTFGKENLMLLPERALYWPRRQIIAIADVHLGKAESFQAGGVPIPSSVHDDDLRLLDRILENYPVKQVLILGDWIHHKDNLTPKLITDINNFFQKHSKVQWTLLLGNHEKGARSALQNIKFDLVDGDLQIDSLTFSHGHSHSQKLSENNFALVQGHIHPVIALREGPINLRLPCFMLNGATLTLPSFGLLTGGYEVSKLKKNRIWAVTPQTVFEIPL